MRAINLRTEHMINPIGIDSKEPYLSWNCEDGRRTDRISDSWLWMKMVWFGTAAG